MPRNVLELGPQIFSVIAGAMVLIGAAIAFTFRYRVTSAKPGEQGQRPPNQVKEAEKVSPDGFIDSFAGVISEAGGGLPFAAWLIMGVTLVCYFVYLFLYWR